MSLEIERKFLVASDEWHDIIKKDAKASFEKVELITQGYLAFPSDNAPEVRVRVVENNPPIVPVPGDLMRPVLTAQTHPHLQLSDQPERYGVLTVKTKGDVIRTEIETHLGVLEAEQMLGVCQGTLISKVRHSLRVDGMLIEVDVYRGALAGLVVAEIELPTPQTPIPHVPWLGQEVSSDGAYKNSSLAKNGKPAMAPPPAASDIGRKVAM